MQLDSKDVARGLRNLSRCEMSAALLDLAPDGMLAVDEAGRVLAANNAVTRLMGTRRIVGRSFIDLLKPSVRGDGMAWLRDMQGRGGFADVCARREDGGLATFQLAVRAATSEGRVIFGCFLREAARRRRGDPHATSQLRVRLAESPDAWRGNDAVHAVPIVYVAAGDARLRELLADSLARCGWNVKTFANIQDLRSRGNPDIPGCAVLDSRLDTDHAWARQRTPEERAALPIICIESLERLSTPLLEGALLGAIQEAIETSTAEFAFRRVARELDARYATLTPREREVMRGVVAGSPNKCVAADLGISEVTVKAHRGRMMRKMHARSLAELVNLSATLVSGNGHAPR